MSNDHHSHSPVNSSMLASINDHGKGGHPNGGNVSNSPIGENVIGDGLKMQSKTLDPISFGGGLDGELLGMFNQGGGPLGRNPIMDVGDGTLVNPGNINAFKGMGHLGHELQNTNMEHVSPGAQLNVATTLGSQHNPSRSGGAEH